jgi:hypothetical protein
MRLLSSIALAAAFALAAPSAAAHASYMKPGGSLAEREVSAETAYSSDIFAPAPAGARAAVRGYSTSITFDVPDASAETSVLE